MACLSEFHSGVWEVMNAAKRHDRRLKQQLRRATAKLSEPSGARVGALAKQPKSKRRQEAGKRKTESLSPWRAEVSTACQELRNEGYKGSLKLKRGMPLYERIQTHRQARLAAAVGAAPPPRSEA